MICDAVTSCRDEVYYVVFTSDCLVSLSLLSSATDRTLPVCHVPAWVTCALPGHPCSHALDQTTSHDCTDCCLSAALGHQAGPAGPTSAVHKITTQSSACQQFSNFSHHKITLLNSLTMKQPISNIILMSIRSQVVHINVNFIMPIVRQEIQTSTYRDLIRKSIMQLITWKDFKNPTWQIAQFWSWSR